MKLASKARKPPKYWVLTTLSKVGWWGTGIITSSHKTHGLDQPLKGWVGITVLNESSGGFCLVYFINDMVFYSNSGLFTLSVSIPILSPVILKTSLSIFDSSFEPVL